MSIHTVKNIQVNGDQVTFDVTLKGSVKDQAVRTNWTVGNVHLTLTGNTLSLKRMLEGYVASGHYWIKIQGWLRKIAYDVVETFVGTTMSWTAFVTAISAALPEGGEKAELKAALATKDQYIEKLRAELRKSGLTDAQIDAALSN